MNPVSWQEDAASSGDLPAAPPSRQNDRVPIILDRQTEENAADVRGTVLCVEDEPVSLALVQAMIGEFPNIRLLSAGTGREAIRLAREEHPDLMLLDMHLPDFGGLEVVRSLNEVIAAKQLKVILLTGDLLSMDVVKAMSLGAHGYWLKPLTRERLRSGLFMALKS